MVTAANRFFDYSAAPQLPTLTLPMQSGYQVRAVPRAQAVE
jgi:hypothetical protein